ncbi:Na+/H+ antiporter subunit E [Nocardioides sp. TF02-7]|uniref:Na+/H+ antiporter subunit E n=1 Tax=Nocardioides sp. TF02-7 TaxID=2917724 RepID=UPI001F0639F0|nr:Na+/H+ antiporter subunit E [Nocardioides sp. TF02-7]UMG92759.1 Na+/H+ antiporter subunit E [Nocardioides sp. TF02-7]
MRTAPQRPDELSRPPRVAGLQPAAVLWLAAVWVALWGDLSAFTVVGGLVVAVAVCLVFPFPRLRMRLRVRPLWLGWLVVRFLADVVVASVQVSWTTLQLRREPRNAVIEVDLRTDSDLVLTVVAEMTSLVPGSLVVEARRSTHTLFLHVLDAGDQRGVDKMRRQTFALERRVVMALGADTGPVQETRSEEVSS